MTNKIYILNFNGVLDGVAEHYRKTDQLTQNPHEADVFVFWQDIRGECLDVAKIVKESLKKPLLVMQHGRGATRDYLPPNSFKLMADKIMVWGESEKQRLLRAGVSDDRILVVGCPLFPMLKPRNKERLGINVLLVPVISTKEEPENLMVFAELKKWESNRLIKRLVKDYAKLKQGWAHEANEIRRVALPDGKVEDRLWKKEVKANLPRNVTYSDGLINVKLTGVHDVYQYQAPLIVSNQGDQNHARQTCELLRDIDAIVCLEEGTMQLIAAALDIPVIVVDIFKYGDYGGTKDYDRVEKIKTDACYWVRSLDKLGTTLDHALAHPEERRKHRISVCEFEGGAHLGDQTGNAVEIINSYLSPKRLCEA